jgi:hypothetical protein
MAQNPASSAGRRLALKYRSHRSPDGKGRPARDKLTRRSDPWNQAAPPPGPRPEGPGTLLSADLHLLKSLARGRSRDTRRGERGRPGGGAPDSPVLVP